MSLCYTISANRGNVEIQIMNKVTEKQAVMLELVARCGENAAAESNIEFDGGLWFRNRERVIDSLKRRDLITDDWELTDAGRIALARVS